MVLDARATARLEDSDCESRTSDMDARLGNTDSSGDGDSATVSLDSVDVPESLLESRSPPGTIYSLTMVKTRQGFGFNIIGGSDSQHYPDCEEIFVSYVKPGGCAATTRRIKEGDRIIQVNNRFLSGLRHEDAANVFRSIPVGQAALFVFEAGAHKLLLERESRLHPYLAQHVDGKPLVESSMSAAPSEQHRERSIEEDEQSVGSYAPSTHYVIDDVPRTPKKPLSLLDPRNNSLFTELLYVSIGLAVITGAGFLGYRILTRRK